MVFENWINDDMTGIKYQTYYQDPSLYKFEIKVETRPTCCLLHVWWISMLSTKIIQVPTITLKYQSTIFIGYNILNNIISFQFF